MNIILLGKSASGKDYTSNLLVKQGYEKIISYTTRPMRSNEKEGIDYYFVDLDTMLDMIKNHELLEYRVYHTVYGDWYYGVKKEENIDNKVIITDVQGCKEWIKEYGRDKFKIYYLDCKDKVRLERAKNRDKGFDMREWKRREKDDKKKFKWREIKKIGGEKVKC